MSGNVRKIEAMAVSLAAGASLVDAAESAGYSPRHASRIAGELSFRRRVAELRTALTDRLLGRLIDGSLQAEETLRALLGDESPSARLGAAKALISLASQLRADVELEERLTDLEARVESLPGARRHFPVRGRA